MPPDAPHRCSSRGTFLEDRSLVDLCHAANILMFLVHLVRSTAPARSSPSGVQKVSRSRSAKRGLCLMEVGKRRGVALQLVVFGGGGPVCNVSGVVEAGAVNWCTLKMGRISGVQGCRECGLLLPRCVCAVWHLAWRRVRCRIQG
jgi:hypothetical protein